MTPAAAPETPPAPRRHADLLVDALSRGEYGVADRVLCSGPGAPLPSELHAAAERLMRTRRWAGAAWLFDRLPEESRDVGTGMKRRLSSNLAALQKHRPGIYDLLVALPAQHRYELAATPSGRPTIHCRRQDGTVASLSGGPDPLAAAAAVLERIYRQTVAGDAVAVCGLGDGYLALLLAHNPPTLFMDKEQPVYLIEPEPQVLLQCLMIHDYAGAAGPIEGARFRWFLGADWAQSLQACLAGDPYLAAPSVTVGQGSDGATVQEGLREVAGRLAAREGEVASEITRYYARLGPADFAAAFSAARAEPPRVLLLTTRFSTVLQYSTRDTAAAFGRLGWESRVVIEPSPHHRVLRSAVASALAEFKPDLVFQIDHLRHEHDGLFPDNLPFACWIQDHLPHLASAEAGARVGEADFVLTDAIATYADKFAYPGRQCIPLPKLVVTADPAVPGEGPADDISFVSNASLTADAMLAEALRRHARNAPTRELITRCCAAMVEVYDRGDALPTYNDVCAVLRRALAELELSLSADGFDVLARWLTHPFNDALYRQQALRWAAAAAREHGWTLALYGKGWESHPEFRPHARGPVAYGEPLRRLTRRTRINLQIVPYLCLHQRLLDGLMAGGFFLVRTHPSDVAPAALLQFLRDGAAGAARSTAEALATLPPTKHAALADLLARCRPCLCTTGAEDVVAMTRAWQEAGQLTPDDGPLPMFGDVGFKDAAGLVARVRTFIDDAALRGRVVDRQRRSVGARLSYDSGVRRVVGRMRDLLFDTAAGAKSAGGAGGLRGHAA